MRAGFSFAFFFPFFDRYRRFEFSRELDFQKGAIVTLNRQIDENWFEGELDGRKGIFPVRYVEVREEEKTKSKVEENTRVFFFRFSSLCPKRRCRRSARRRNHSPPSSPSRRHEPNTNSKAKRRRNSRLRRQGGGGMIAIYFSYGRLFLLERPDRSDS